jgi:NADH-quinone oxidoreductase subunit N
VLRAMYLDPSEERRPVRVRTAFAVTGWALAIPTVALGVYWGPLYDFVAGALGGGR